MNRAWFNYFFINFRLFENLTGPGPKQSIGGASSAKPFCSEGENTD